MSSWAHELMSSWAHELMYSWAHELISWAHELMSSWAYRLNLKTGFWWFLITNMSSWAHELMSSWAHELMSSSWAHELMSSWAHELMRSHELIFYDIPSRSARTSCQGMLPPATVLWCHSSRPPCSWGCSKVFSCRCTQHPGRFQEEESGHTWSTKNANPSPAHTSLDPWSASRGRWAGFPSTFCQPQTFLAHEYEFCNFNNTLVKATLRMERHGEILTTRRTCFFSSLVKPTYTIHVKLVRFASCTSLSMASPVMATLWSIQ